jgi:hypothetical protein
MAILIFLALCAAGVGFLLFALVHFVRDEKNGRTNGPAALKEFGGKTVTRIRSGFE